MTLHEQHIAIVDSAAEYADVEGLRILAPREVYHPHKWSSTRFLMTALPDVAGLDVLEIGGGSGALALAIKQRGAAKVVATDISEKACAAMECNALLNNLDIDVRHGDMFDPLQALLAASGATPLQDSEQFDLVIFNLPLMNKPVASQTEVALCDPDGDLLTRFLRGLPTVIKTGGQALFTHANISAPLPLCIPGRIGTVTEMRRDGCEIFRVLWWRP
jgi:methylase of polypeptide subunit release factors